MKPLTPKDVLSAEEYERVRPDFQRRIIALKEARRISVGQHVTLVFENRDTVLFQIQEMIRAERIFEQARIQEEVDTYNEQLPGAGELSATLLIEVTDPAQVKPILDLFQGIDRGRTVGLKVGTQVAYGFFEQGRSKDDKISAVHYVRFSISEAMKRELASPVPMQVFIHHPGYEAEAIVPDRMRSSLLQDLKPD
ncbi:MAG: DUF3501 family protein [Nitrospirae bacterium]|nr:MAG: DUF3501 family protein [Nitrospirota bacterium]